MEWGRINFHLSFDEWMNRIHFYYRMVCVCRRFIRTGTFKICAIQPKPVSLNVKQNMKIHCQLMTFSMSQPILLMDGVMTRDMIFSSFFRIIFFLRFSPPDSFIDDTTTRTKERKCHPNVTSIYKFTLSSWYDDTEWVYVSRVFCWFFAKKLNDRETQFRSLKRNTQITARHDKGIYDYLFVFFCCAQNVNDNAKCDDHSRSTYETRIKCNKKKKNKTTERRLNDLKINKNEYQQLISIISSIVVSIGPYTAAIAIKEKWKRKTHTRYILLWHTEQEREKKNSLRVLFAYTHTHMQALTS